MAKRTLEEFADVSKVVYTSPSAMIHGVVSSLSPMKKSKTSSCSFFDGEVTDGKAEMRVFGFDSGVWRKLSEFERSKNTVAIKDCEVKCARKGEQLEIMVTKRTEVEKSEKMFTVESTDQKATKVTTLGELNKLVTYQRVSVEVKALHVEDVMKVSGGKRKQDIIIGDSSGCTRLTVWEGEIGKIEEDESYRLSGMMVWEYRGKKFLSTSKENSEIEVIDDIGDVEEESDEENGASNQCRPAELHDVS